MKWKTAEKSAEMQQSGNSNNNEIGVGRKWIRAAEKVPRIDVKKKPQ